MAANLIPGNREDRVFQSILGGQDYLHWHHPAYQSAPGSGGTNDPLGGNANSTTGLIAGGRLIDTTALPIGTYFAAFPMNGMASINVHLLLSAIGGGATITSTIYSTYKDHATQYTAFTGTGALVAGTEQISTDTTPLGEQWAIVKLVVTVANATGLVWTRAEYNGQRA